jgi:hypothetical protein
MRMGSVGYWCDTVCNREFPYLSIYTHGSRGRTSDVSHSLYAESLYAFLFLVARRLAEFWTLVGLCILRDMGLSSDMTKGHYNSH